MKKFRLIFILISILLAIFIAYKIASPGKKPNIIFISIDTLRQDHVGAYGYERDVTPVLDNIANEGVMYKNSYSAAPWTLPSHMSMFTGLPPSVHKVDFDLKVLGNNINTFPELLKKKGYETGGFVSAIYLKHMYGYSRGFDIYKEMYKKGCEEITDTGINWISQRSNSPFFLFIHYFDVHWPYHPPKEYTLKMDVDTNEKKWRRYGRLKFLRKFSVPESIMTDDIREKIINLYDAEILRVDTNIGRLISFLKERGLYENTIIVITSDHGEEFKEHGSFGHFHQLYSELINVPLIIRYPEKFPSGKVVKESVSSVDISRTLLSLSGSDIPDQFKKYGRNLLNIARSEDQKESTNGRELISETRKGSSHHFALISNGYKYITPYRFFPIVKNKKWVSVGSNLYNTENDRMEKNNLMSLPLSNDIRKRVLDPSRKEIAEYTKKNIDSIRIVFFPPEFGEAVLTGKMKYKVRSEFTPFGVNFTDNDSIDSSLIDGIHAFKLRMSREKKEIVLHLTKKLCENKAFSLKIFTENKLIVDRSIDLSKLSKAQLLFKGESGSIYVLKIGTLNKTGKAKHTKKELKLLKSLGYIN